MPYVLFFASANGKTAIRDLDAILVQINILLPMPVYYPTVFNIYVNYVCLKAYRRHRV